MLPEIDDAQWNSWINFIMTYDGIDEIQSYVNGVAGTPWTETGTDFSGPNNVALLPDPGDLILGARGTENSFFMDGVYDDVGVWSRKLNAEEIALIWSAGVAIPDIVEATPTPIIPTLAAWGLIAMTLSILAAGTIMLHRRRRNPTPI